MLRKSSSALILTTALAFGGALGTQAAAQSMTPGQCDQVMMVGPQHYAPAVLAACSSYFTSLADGAVAEGTFQTIRPGATVTVSTSGTGG